MALFKLSMAKKQSVKANQKSTAGKTNALDLSLRAKMYDLRMNNNSNKNNILDTSLRAKMYDLRMYNFGKSRPSNTTPKIKNDVGKKSSASSGMYMTSDFMAYGLTKWKQYY